MDVQRLDIGIAGISRWRKVDEVHLPRRSRIATRFLPERSLLDEILRRPSLDEQLAELLEPQFVDPELLEPAILAEAREQVHEAFSLGAAGETTSQGPFHAAADLLERELALDGIVCSYLAALLRG